MVTLLTQAGIGGGPELTSNPFTPLAAGDCILVVWSAQSGGSTPTTVTLTTAGYTWNYSGQFLSADSDVVMQAAWAFNVPAGEATFHTTGLGYDGMTYYVLDLGPVTALDQTGEVLTPNPSGGSAAEVTTAGPLAQTGEVAVAWQQTQFAEASVTAMAGFTTTQQQGNTAFGPLNTVVAWNAAAGTAGSPLTGGWTSITTGAGNAMMLTFENPSGGAGYQTGFPKSGEIEEPSEGLQNSQATPPSMGPVT